MQLEGKVVLLTGAAATGKSSVAKFIASHFRPVKKVDFGQLLLDRKLRTVGAQLTYDELREKSAQVVTSEDVKSVDAELIDSVQQLRKLTNVIIDSHAVTRETYGYRVTHYSDTELRHLAFDLVIITYCEPDELVRRHTHDPRGRPPISAFEAQHQMGLQESVGLHYAIVSGCRAYLLNTTERTVSAVATELCGIMREIGAVLEPENAES